MSLVDNHEVSDAELEERNEFLNDLKQKALDKAFEGLSPKQAAVTWVNAVDAFTRS